MIIGIFGRKRSGKDTTFDVISELVREESLVPERRKFADKVYEAAAVLTGMSREDVEMLKEWSEGDQPYPCMVVVTPHLDPQVSGGDGPNLDVIVNVQTTVQRFTMREILERIGTEMGRNIFGEDFWVEQTLPGEFLDYRTDHVYGVTDMRFPNEYERVRNLGGKVIKVIGTPEIQSMDISGHPSRGALIEDRDYDWILDNSERDMDKLRSQVVEMLAVLHDA